MIINYIYVYIEYHNEVRVKYTLCVSCKWQRYAFEGYRA